jgi:hypothetical protein
VGCVGCEEKAKAKPAEPQTAVRFRAEVYQDGELKSFVGYGFEDFAELPDFPALTLGFRVEFSDGCARTSSGRRWIYCIPGWTLDDDDDANLLLLKYPKAVFKPGGTVPESVMQDVNKRLQELID